MVCYFKFCVDGRMRPAEDADLPENYEAGEGWILLSNSSNVLGDVYIHNCSLYDYVAALGERKATKIFEDETLNPRATDLVQYCLGRQGSMFLVYQLKNYLVRGNLILKVANPVVDAGMLAKVLSSFCKSGKDIWMQLVKAAGDYYLNSYQERKEACNMAAEVSCNIYRLIPELGTPEDDMLVKNIESSRGVLIYPKMFNAQKVFDDLVKMHMAYEDAVDILQELYGMSTASITRRYKLKLLAAAIGAASWALHVSSTLTVKPEKRSLRIQQRKEAKIYQETVAKMNQLAQNQYARLRASGDDSDPMLSASPEPKRLRAN